MVILFLNVTYSPFLLILIICLPLILKWSLIWRLNISFMKACKQLQTKMFSSTMQWIIKNECIEIFHKNMKFFSPSPINKKSTFFFTTVFWYIYWVLFLIFINKNVNADRNLLFSFPNVSSFYWKIYVFKIKLFGKIFVNYCNSYWMMIFRI